MDVGSYAIHDTLNTPPADPKVLSDYVAHHPGGVAAGELNGVIGLVANVGEKIPGAGILVKARAEAAMKTVNDIGDAFDHGWDNFTHGRPLWA